MDEKYIEDSVRETVEDLKKKIDALTLSCEDADESIADKVDSIKDKAVRVFSDVTDKLNYVAATVSDEKELEQAIGVIKDKSKEFYDNAMSRISELKKEAAPEPEKAEEVLEEKKEEEKEKVEIDVVEEVKKGIDDLIVDAREGISGFMNREDVRETVDKAKAGAVDIAEKTLDILKGWLMPDGEDQ